MRTRQRILAYLQKVSTASTADVARALGCTQANARHHLNVLVADGRVTVVCRRREGRGRPLQVYGLSPALAGDNLAGLVDALLKEHSPNPQVLARHLLGGEIASGQPLMRRLHGLIERLNAMHYQAHWEAGAEGPRVIFGRCPYAAVIEQHPELCSMDEALIQQVLGRSVRLVHRMEEGQGHCMFAVREHLVAVKQRG